jgi:hypothetical protein
MNQKATDFYDSLYPHSLHLPKTAIIDLMVAFAIKWSEHQSKLEKFNSEQFVSQHNFSEVRKQFLKDKDQPPKQ